MCLFLGFTEKAKDVARSINETGGKALAVVGDMLDAKHIEDLVKRAAEFGEGKIHIIVNNVWGLSILLDDSMLMYPSRRASPGTDLYTGFEIRPFPPTRLCKVFENPWICLVLRFFFSEKFIIGKNNNYFVC